METGTKVADHGHGQAATQNILAGQQNTTSSRTLVRTSQVGSQSEALVAIDHVACSLRGALGPRLTVEPRS